MNGTTMSDRYVIVTRTQACLAGVTDAGRVRVVLSGQSPLEVADVVAVRDRQVAVRLASPVGVGQAPSPLRRDARSAATSDRKPIEPADRRSAIVRHSAAASFQALVVVLS